MIDLIERESTPNFQFDGEMLGKVAIDCKVVPGAVRILTPTAQAIALI